MEDDKELTLDLEQRWPFKRYLPHDEWLKYRRDIDCEEEEIGWGE